jgi:hypothetical protein
MARATVDAQSVNTTAALAPTMTTIGADGVSLPQDNEVIIVVENATEAPINFVVVPSLTEDGVTMPNKSIAIPATSGKRYFRMFTSYIYTRDGRIWINGADLTIAAIRG